MLDSITKTLQLKVANRLPGGGSSKDENLEESMKKVRFFFCENEFFFFQSSDLLINRILFWNYSFVQFTENDSDLVFLCQVECICFV